MIRETVDWFNRGFLWENGGPIVDLQTLVLPGSDITIVETNYINDAGEISGFGTNSNGDQRAILLIPCDDNHPGQCADNSRGSATQQARVTGDDEAGRRIAERIQPIPCETDSGEAFTFPVNRPHLRISCGSNVKCRRKCIINAPASEFTQVLIDDSCPRARTPPVRSPGSMDVDFPPRMKQVWVFACHVGQKPASGNLGWLGI